MKRSNMLCGLVEYRYHFLGKAATVLMIAVYALASCEKDSANLSISRAGITFDSAPLEPETVDVSGNVAWRDSVVQTGKWLTVTPASGSANGVLSFMAEENATTLSRYATVFIIGEEGVDTLRIDVTQTPGINVAENIGDEIFREYCLENFDANRDGALSLAEARAVKNMEIKDMEIVSLAGIEYFSTLEALDCSFNEKIANLDVRKNTGLSDLRCSNNKLAELDVSLNTNLTVLECSNNMFTSLDVSKNTLLNIFYCDNNQLAGIDVSNNPELIYLHCSYNQLTALNVKMNKKLVDLFCSNNQLADLDLSENIELRYFYCQYNNFTAIDISKNTELGHGGLFGCMGNVHLTTVYVWPGFGDPPAGFTKPETAIYVEK